MKLSAPFSTRVASLFHPERFHGHGLRRSFFEGWYFKFVNAAGTEAWAVIPGIFLGPDGSDSHAFIQVLQGKSGRSWYHRLPLDSFRAATDRFEINLGPSRFHADGFDLHVDKGDLHLHGSLRFGKIAAWPWRPWSPGIMGPFSFTPFMECSHGVLSLDHGLSGSLQVTCDTPPTAAGNDKERVASGMIDFTAGRGYVEKDWGKSFPRAWVWMQTNHFDRTGISLTASIAHIPWLGSSFRGFIVGFLMDGRLHRFATYLGSRTTELRVDEARVHWALQHRRLRLELTAERRGGGLLHAPMREKPDEAAPAMAARVLESLTASVRVRLFDLRAGKTLFEGKGRHAGLEVGGNIGEIANR